MKKLVIGILAHVDAGKTTLCEALLYKTGAIRSQGRVDRRDSFLDNFYIERERGITIFSKQARLSFGDTEAVLLDTPGHADFSAEMERTLSVLDAAVLVISGTDGVQAHTETLWELLRSFRIPVFIFITKMDVAKRERAELVSELKDCFGDGCIDISLPGADEELAMQSEALLEKYMAAGELADDDIARAVAERRVFPCYFGSGLKLDGVDALLDGLDRLCSAPRYSDAFGAKIFKIARDERGNRLTYMKITGGEIRVRQGVRYLPLSGSEPVDEKISELRLYSGAKFETAETVGAGDVCAVTGLSKTLPGQGLGIERDNETVYLQPALDYGVILPKGLDPKAVLPQLRQLEEEDPMLRVSWNSHTQEIRIQLMGAVQTDILRRLVKDRFGSDISIGPGRILYRETIEDTVEGIGHYEPLRHYAEVHLLLEPGERGSGIVIDSVCPTDALALNWQRLVLTHLEEKEFRGVLTGSPITDIKITLISGAAHIKHTEGGDFRQATYRAVRQGLMQAKSILLEPYYDFHLEVPSECIGRAITDVHSMGGKSDPPEAHGGWTSLTGSAPVSAMADYINEVAAYTGGRGRFSCRTGGYLPCKSAQAVIEEIGYSPEADVSNPADSVFCSHGAGTAVSWREVSQYCHIPPLEKGGYKSSEELLNEYVPPRGPVTRSTDIDEKELEAIMQREFGGIHRRVYSAPKINSAQGSSGSAIRKTRVIIDGYNVIFGWDELKALALDSIDMARDRLIDIIASWQGYTKTETVLVFDAYRVPGGRGEKYNESDVHIVFTKEGESADKYIEQLANEIGKNENVRVVSSDSLIQLSALRSGVMRVSTREFKEEVDGVMESIRKAISSAGGTHGTV